MLQQWVDSDGIGFYTATADRPRPCSPFRWPWLGVSIDQGSDGWAATQYAIQKLRANWERIPDPSHGAGRISRCCLLDNIYIYIKCACVLVYPPVANIALGIVIYVYIHVCVSYLLGIRASILIVHVCDLHLYTPTCIYIYGYISEIGGLIPIGGIGFGFVSCSSCACVHALVRSCAGA